MSTDLSTANLAGIFLITGIFSVLSTLAGVGGGAIFIPLYILVGGLEVKPAIIMSISAMLGSTVSRIFYYAVKRNPDYSQRYLPNWDLIRVFLPFNGNASYLGFLLNLVLPDWAILILIVVLMIIVIGKTSLSLYRFWREWKKSHHSNSIKCHTGQDTTIQISEITGTSTNTNIQSPETQIGETKLDLTNHLLYALLIMCLLAFFSFIRQQLADQSGKSDIGGWPIYLVQALIFILFGYSTTNYIRLQDRWRRLSQFQLVEPDIPWSSRWEVFKVVVISSLTGACSALLGIGGGLIMNPLMLHFHIHPNVMLATSAWTTFFSVLASAVQYFVFDQTILDWTHGAVFGIACATAILGLIILQFMEGHRAIKVLISLILVITMILCGILLIVINIVRLT